MDHAQEQNEEIEALRSIFDDVQVSETDPKTIAMTISAEPVSLVLQITYVEKYPEEVPLIAILESSGMSDEELQLLSSQLSSQAEESLGMAMVFALHATAKEFVDNKVAVMERDAEALRRKLEEEANLAEVERQIVGTIVTTETFEAWRSAFMKDVIVRQDAAVAAARAARKGRLTGRQLFERDASLLNSDIMKDAAADEVAVDASLFADLDLDDIGDAGAPSASLFQGQTFSDED